MMSPQSSPRAATEIDKFIGIQIRVCRSAAGLSQEALAEAIGVTFQQIQKYEKGVNRVSAAALFRIAQSLNIESSALMPRVIGKAPPLDLETITALTQPISRLNSSGRELLVVLAQALASHRGMRT
jgi:transcriptional regulator with XRE-family HTH domain